MSTTLREGPEGADPTLAAEVHDLESREEALESRTRSLEFAEPLALILAVVAIALALGALIVALAKDDGGATMMGRAATTGMMGGSTSTGASMMGAGRHGSFTPAQMAAAGRGTIHTQLGDYWVAPTVGSVAAGRVTFVAKNVGRVPHELMIEKMPMKFDSPMHPTESSAQGMIEDMEAGQSGRMTLNLRPGSYMLFCNVEGHYVAGQHIPFTVTGS